jgi:hypothetical protein
MKRVFQDFIADAVPNVNGLDVNVVLICQAPMVLMGDKCGKPSSYLPLILVT